MPRHDLLQPEGVADRQRLVQPELLALLLRPSRARARATCSGLISADTGSPGARLMIT